MVNCPGLGGCPWAPHVFVRARGQHGPSEKGQDRCQRTPPKFSVSAGNCAVEAAFRRSLFDRACGSGTPCKGRMLDSRPVARCGGLCPVHRRGGRGGQDLRGARHADHRVRNRNLAGRTRQCGQGRRLRGSQPDAGDPGGQYRGSGLPGSGGRDPKPAERPPAGYRACFSRSIRVPTPRWAE